MTRENRASNYALWVVLMVTAAPALYLVMSDTLFYEQPVIDTLATSLALAILVVLALNSFWDETYRVMSLRQALRHWGRLVGKAFPVMLTVYSVIRLVDGKEPLWWYITATCVGLVGVFGAVSWWFLKEIARVGL